VAAALTTIRGTDAWPATKLAFKFLTLTACRSGEVRLAEWAEVDLAGQVWTIPGDKMKTGRNHRIPLSRQAMDVLRQARELADDSGLIFPSVRGKALSDATISKLLRENGIAAVPHGFRSSFRMWAAECTDVPREVCEFALAHVVGSAAEQAY
jgi:integrase